MIMLHFPHELCAETAHGKQKEAESLMTAICEALIGHRSVPLHICLQMSYF